MKVKATNAYEELKLKAVELDRVPKAGEVFEIKNEKFQFLNGNNSYKKVFVEKTEEDAKENIKENENELDGKEQVEEVLKGKKKNK